jgi:hypothetical protein
MHVIEYIEFTGTTALYPGVGTRNKDEISYVGLGFVNEATELLAKMEFFKPDLLCMPNIINGILDELFDVAWYWARMKFVLNDYSVPALTVTFDNHEVALKRLIINAGKVAGRAKKILRDNLDYSPGSATHDELLHYLNLSYAAMKYLASYFGVTFEEGLDLNVMKLTDRKERDVLCGDGDNR